MSVLPALWAGGTTLAAPLLRVSLRGRARRGKEIAARLAEREGIDPTPRPSGWLLWLHAASVGESVSVLPVLRELARRSPELNVLLTTGTVTSARLLADRLGEVEAPRVLHRFAPLDVPRWARRFLDHWRPDAAAFVESELWPNLLAGCRARGIPTMLVNGRLSDRSFARWRCAPGAARQVMGMFDRIWAQGEADAARFRALGAARVEVRGNLKFAAPPLPADMAEVVRLRALLAGRPCWVAASTHPGEEAIVIAAHRALAARCAGLLTILVPRHPERGAEVAVLAGNLPMRRRALGEAPPETGGVWIADTLGELGLWYRLAPVALVGRSLVPPGGGQNPLEPVRLGCVVASGPLMGNFAEAAAALEAAGALARVRDGAELARFVAAMLDDPARRAVAAEAGRAAIARYAELPGATADALLELLD
ncbi:MAG TPA: 3-deoxy-D-manno-octulosonic acid transferase [Acetobacteraceae bacterium]|nr:3-deoxy-D-manno-octulosonic acid transferase [Acetobacteraceae bacterium]